MSSRSLFVACLLMARCLFRGLLPGLNRMRRWPKPQCAAILPRCDRCWQKRRTLMRPGPTARPRWNG